MNKIIITLCIVALSQYSFSFEINPYIKTIKKFDDAHEQITKKSLTLVDKKLLQKYEFVKIQREIIKGSLWNDDPQNFLTSLSQLDDFYIYMKDSCKKVNEINENYTIFYRSHCGDMQFLHSMAAKPDETAQETLNKILMWLEFTYKVSTGEIPHNRYFRSINKLMEKDSGELFKKMMTNTKINEKCISGSHPRCLWKAENLFTLKCDRDYWKFKCKGFHSKHPKDYIMNLALGSALHLIQDSFSDSHASRNPQYPEQNSKITGRKDIKYFSSYVEQKSSKHGKADKLPSDLHKSSKSENLNLVEVCATIISYTLTDRMNGNSQSSWGKVKKYLLDEVFVLENPESLPKKDKYSKR